MHTFELRQKDKSKSRQKDADDLRSGKKSINDLKKENYVFKLVNFKIDFSKLK